MGVSRLRHGSATASALAAALMSLLITSALQAGPAPVLIVEGAEGTPGFRAPERETTQCWIDEEMGEELCETTLDFGVCVPF